MSKQTLTVVLLWAIAIFVTPVVLVFSSRWESQAHPIRGVTIEFASGQKLTGDLSTDWSGLKVLRTADQVVIFNRESIAGMASTLPRPVDFQPDLLEHWRLVVGPALLLSFVVLLASTLWPKGWWQFADTQALAADPAQRRQRAA